MAIEFAGFVYDDAGDAVVGATVNLYDRNTVTPVRATDTTDANGYWNISHATQGMFDIEIVNGTTKRRLKYDNGIQQEELEVAILAMRNPGNTFKYDITPAAITADRILTLPLITAGDTLVSLALAQTLTNKTLTAPAISQVVFPASQDASANANTLDDYEEGVWTPAITFGGAAVGLTYATQTGYYTKVGRAVHIHCFINMTAKGTSVGSALITGLPFAVASAYAIPSLRLVAITFANVPVAYCNVGTSTIVLEEVTEAGVSSALTDADFANTSIVQLSVSYIV